jgi:hypothetical protein
MDLKNIFKQFNAPGTWLDAAPTGSGHIHETWLIRTAEEEKPDYIIQKINHNVFPPVAEMMSNIQKVTTHIRKKKAAGDKGQVLEIIETGAGKTHYTDPGGINWRMYRKISPGRSYDIVPNEKVALEAGKAFGQFIADLRDLPADEIYPVIPDFNSMEMRFGQFKHAIQADPADRVKEVGREIEFANARIDDMMVITRLGKEGKLPLRITHNDTKLNNVLFDDNDNAVCVIDLDTVMPGLSLYDFGDTIRTAANTGQEDEADLGKIEFSLAVFKAFSEGFLDSTLPFLTPSEVDYMALSSQYMTFIMGLRFLTDYVNGDVYYTIRHEKHNLRRCRAQFRLMDCMKDRYHECQDIIMKLDQKFQAGQKWNMSK